MLQKPLIYAVDDELSIRELYSCALLGSGFLVECFEKGDELFDAINKDLPNLILLDIMLDGLDGYAILEAIRKNKKTADIPVIMVSAKGEEISKVKGLNLGADDYISKPFGILELSARINANLRRNFRKSSKCEYKDIVVDDNAHEIIVNGNKIQTTLKEYELIKLLVENASNVLLRDKIFEKVWGVDFGGETRTLDIHIASIRKLLSGSITSIDTIRGVGYVLK